MRSSSRLSRRKYLVLPLTLAVAASALIAVPSAQADTRIPVKISGTSDVSDSNLIASVIEPGFEAAYPQYDLQYNGKATSLAIGDAEGGLADGMIVHAASLENQFVAAGYSAEPFGRAIFWGDFVLAGPANDPAGVLSTAPSAQHDIVTAFERIAAAGAAGKATFVSRGGGAGTTVAEHAIWSLSGTSPLCTVSDANGGGSAPQGASPTGSCGSQTYSPAWYEVTGAKQAANVQQADACTTPGYNVGCYVFTDRGTFDYLKTQNSINNLQIVTRDNASSARGTNLALVNSFHAYAVNPAKFPSGTINSAGATAFLNYLTSPAAQAAVGGYLANNTADSAPFIPSAAPKLTASPLPASVVRSTPFTVTGTLANVVPGTPALANKTVTLKAAPVGSTAAGTSVATGVTDATGHFSITYSPIASQTYSLSTPESTQIENSNLNPIFADQLAAATLPLSTVAVTLTKAKVSITKIKVSKKFSALITLQVTPKAAGTSTIDLYGRNSNTKSAGLHVVKTAKVKAGASTVTIRVQLIHGKHTKKVTWKLKAKYLGSQIVTTTSTKKTVVLR